MGPTQLSDVEKARIFALREENVPVSELMRRTDSFKLTRASVFQQDSALAHTAKSVTQWLDDCMVPFIKDWPGNSLDLNPIENLWHMVKKDLQGKDVSSIPKLKKAIQSKGQLEAEEGTYTSHITQTEIKKAVDLTSAAKSFDLVLDQFGPYK
ncbi:Transposable element Tcb2 transposase [Chionoecetes opilio]|uniref:Transposable element Tcb2 transposase n=1 Tax=Chionoecetes opilio TaxID=41210 RepID=A0A8J4YLN1_CHIOP|nr:Transposable element Tcb2 transposase [Chionoecetes opilio]